MKNRIKEFFPQLWESYMAEQAVAALGNRPLPSCMDFVGHLIEQSKTPGELQQEEFARRDCENAEMAALIVADIIKRSLRRERRRERRRQRKLNNQ